MALLTAVLVVTVCSVGDTKKPCGTYKLADFYGAFEQVGVSHCDALSQRFNATKSPAGSKMLYMCLPPSQAAKLVDADLDRDI